MNNINSEILRSMICSASNNLQNNRALINDYNVFPVPDGDTGTNMSLTFSGAASQIKEYKTDSCGALLNKLASSALRCARGNSGVILSQLFRGFTKEIKEASIIDAKVVARSFERAVETAYKAVMKPKEGTILTVAKGVAEKAEPDTRDASGS